MAGVGTQAEGGSHPEEGTLAGAGNQPHTQGEGWVLGGSLLLV